LELGLHLPLMEFGDEGQSITRLGGAVDAARENGFAAVSANDHFLFQTPWLDGATALAAVIDRSGAMELATTVANVALRGPVPLAKTLAALDVLSDGRVIAGVGPGSSERDYDAVGVPFEERWERFDEAVAILRSLLRDEPPPETRRHYALPDSPLAPAPRRPGGVPVWLATMWTWITEDAGDADRVLREGLAPLLRRDGSWLGAFRREPSPAPELAPGAPDDEEMQAAWEAWSQSSDRATELRGAPQGAIQAGDNSEIAHRKQEVGAVLAEHRELTDEYKRLKAQRPDWKTPQRSAKAAARGCPRWARRSTEKLLEQARDRERRFTGKARSAIVRGCRSRRRRVTRRPSFPVRAR
jgi:hypothetical protein